MYARRLAQHAIVWSAALLRAKPYACSQERLADGHAGPSVSWQKRHQDTIKPSLCGVFGEHALPAIFLVAHVRNRHLGLIRQHQGAGGRQHTTHTVHQRQLDIRHLARATLAA